MKELAPLKKGELLIKGRKQKGLTQSELAKMLNIDRTALSNYENNKRTPRGELAKQLSQILEINLEDII